MSRQFGLTVRSTKKKFILWSSSYKQTLKIPVKYYAIQCRFPIFHFPWNRLKTGKLLKDLLKINSSKYGSLSFKNLVWLIRSSDRNLIKTCGSATNLFICRPWALKNYCDFFLQYTAGFFKMTCIIISDFARSHIKTGLENIRKQLKLSSYFLFSMYIFIFLANLVFFSGPFSPSLLLKPTVK
jgi:hypothetical protein